MSAMNSYSRPFHENKTGHELPRRSSSAMLCTFFAARFISSCGTPVGHSSRTTSALRSEPSKNWRSVLAKIAGRTGHFPLLIQRARVEFDFGPDSALVVVERLEVDAHPVVLIAALIAQNKRRAAELRHDQVRVAVSIDIGNRNRARLIQLDRIEVNILRSVGPALGPQISQQPKFRSVARLSRGD